MDARQWERAMTKLRTGGAAAKEGIEGTVDVTREYLYHRHYANDRIVDSHAVDHANIQ